MGIVSNLFVMGWVASPAVTDGQLIMLKPISFNMAFKAVHFRMGIFFKLVGINKWYLKTCYVLRTGSFIGMTMETHGFGLCLY
jgi:hypothetical protein